MVSQLTRLAGAEHTKSEMKTHDFGEKPVKSNDDDDELAQKLGNRGKPDYSSGVTDQGR